jgi:ketosteroid isomerase-like protein
VTSPNVELVRRIYADWGRGDFSSADWAHPEIDYEVADGPLAGRWKGVEAMAASWGDVLRAFEGLHAEAEELREVGDDCVLALIHNTGRGKVSGLDLGQVASHGANVFYVQDGQVTRLVVYWERERAFADLGLSG